MVIGMTKEMIANDEKAYKRFCEAENGIFDGFEMSYNFAKNVDKSKIIYECEADDTATARTPFGDFETAEDGAKVYFFSKKPTKRVDFNCGYYFF